MDLNTKIIEAVRQQPSLYGKNTLEERNRAWKQLADKLNIQEQYLKIRWHSLVQRYQSDANFKYAQKMQFVQRNVTPAQEGNWPEFLITEEDLQERQQDGEEYVFMELDEVENNTKEIKDEPGLEKENQYNDKASSNQDLKVRNVKSLKIGNIWQDKDISSTKTVEILNKNTTPAEKIRNDKETTYDSMPNKLVSSKSTIELENYMETEQPEVNKQKKVELKIVDVQKEKPKKDETTKEEPKMEEPKKVEPPPPVSRCEDDIFGELVSAMLKRMDESKKKNVKKEIMNLLLT